MNLEIIQANYSNAQHRSDIPHLLDEYASDPMGGGQPLDVHVKDKLVPALSKLPHAFTVLAYVDGEAAGLINCFEAFSTFACRPLVNVHDVVVINKYRSKGISLKMLDKVEEIARAKGCCKITLEVLSNNEVAKSAYRTFGFANYELDPAAGIAQFWQKKLLDT